MLVGQKGVKYGLQVRAPPGAKPAAKAAPAKKPSVFGDDDSDGDADNDVEKQIARQAARKQSDKKVAELHAAALAEDASIFDYDSHYDSIQQARAEPKKQEKLQRQSRYIAGLLEKAEERKREQDILYERQLAKERAAEDHLFGDKEKFVTAAYRAKLAERQAWLEEQKRKKEEEEANAVEKRGHMGDFYRNLLRSNVAFGAKPAEAPAKPAAGSAGASRPADQQQRRQQQGQELQHAKREGSPAEEQRGASRERELEGRAEAQPPRAQAGAEPAAADQQQQQQQPEPAEAHGSAAAEAAKAGPAQSPATAAPAVDAGQRRNKEDAVAAARERYLARKRQKTAAS